MPYEFERFLTVRSASAPAFSANGQRVVFLWDITGVPQLWAVDVDGGWPDQLTVYSERVMALFNSPVSDQTVFGMDSGGDERQQLYLLSGNGESIKALTANPQAIHTPGAWTPDGTSFVYASNRRHPALFDIYVNRLSKGEVQMLLEHDGTNLAGAISPDGSSLLINRTVINHYNELYILPLDTARGRPRLVTKGEGRSTYSSPVWSSDGKAVYLLTDQDREWKSLARLDLDAREMTYLHSEEWDVELMAYAPKTERIAFSVNADGYSEATVLSLEDGRSEQVTGLPKGQILDMAWSPNGVDLAVTAGAATVNSDVWLVNGQTAQARRLTHSPRAGIGLETLTEPTLVHYPTFDGRDIPAFFYLPSHAAKDGDLPVVVFVHGGPESQSRPVYNPVVQYLAYRGYGVLVPNVRGSTGYGRTYEHLDDVEKRMDAVNDLNHAAKWLVDSGYSSPRRIAVMGGSYGGFMTLAAITAYPDSWGAAAELYGIANFQTFLANTGPWRRVHRAAEYGDPEKDSDLLKRISPIHYVDSIKVPLIVVHGANDPRVPISETEQMVEAIQKRNGSVEYLRFEDEGHGIVKQHNRIRAYTAIADFLDRHLVNGG